jgi:Subtilase family
MKRRMWLAGVLVALLWAVPARADTGVIVRTTTGLLPLQAFCKLPVSPCTVVGGLDGTLGQVFLVTTPLPPQTFLGLLARLTGFVNAEVDQVLNLVGPNLVPALIPSGLLSDRTLVLLPNSGSTVMVWNSYVNQPASTIVNVQAAQNSFHVAGTGIVADIDTGVDPGHPALQGVLLQGYDFTRNLAGASELNDLSPTDLAKISAQPSPCPPSTCPSPAQVNQSSAAILDQSSAAILDTNTQYAAFGHGTMVMGVIHLVAPTAKLLPLKAFKSDGTGLLSDILRAIYYAVQNNANVINMSFDFKTPSQELTNALAYAGQLTVISAASAGNDGQGPPNLVYPAALQSDVMGVASVGSTTLTMNTRSSFSNYGNGIVWVAAPGEAIVTTYPFSTYSAGWGTSFSAPFVSGGAALLRGLKSTIDETAAANAIAVANALDPALGLNNGRLDLLKALGALPLGSGTPDFSVSAAPSSATIAAGNRANFTVTAAPANNFSGTVTWSCTGAPATTACTVSPSSVMLNGSSTASATVTLTTMARVLAPPIFFPRHAPPMPTWVMLAACFAGFAILLLFCALSRALPQRPGLAAAAGLLALSLCTYACGGGYGTPPGAGGPTLSSVALNPTSVNGGSSSTGTVTLSGPAPIGGAVVSLSSDNTAAATVPGSVAVAYGATSATFTVSTSSVTTSTSATISASYAGVTKTASLAVASQAHPTLSSLTLNPTSVTGGAQSSTGTVTLSGPALTGGAQVLLTSDNGAASVPFSVTVPVGASSAIFTVSTSAVTTSTPVTISASYAGVTKTASLTVVMQALPALSSVTLNPTSVTGGVQSSTGTVTLSGPALTGGAQILLTSDNGAASVPFSVTVGVGATSATFTVSTSAVTVSTPVTISASYAGATKTASLTVAPPGTPAGTYTLTITGTSGTLSHATTVQVIVN